MENVVRFEKFRKLSTSHGLSIKYVSNVDGPGGGVKNWPKLSMDSSEKVPTWGRGMSKIHKKGRRLLWTVPC